MVAAAIIGGAVVGGIGTAVASSNAADAQVKSANKAQQTQQAMYNQTRADLLPYNTVGKKSLNALYGAATANGPDVLQSFNPTQDWLENTPGYKFQLAQGLKATQNSAAARGLGLSGAALKGAAQYTQGLASSNWQQQFEDYLSQQQQRYNQQVANQTNTYNRLMGVGQLGENAAAQTGAYGTQTAANIGQAQIGAGNAQAAGALGIASGISGAANGISNAYMTNALFKSATGSGLFG